MGALNELPQELYPHDKLALTVGTNSSFSIATARALCWVSQLAYESDAGKINGIAARWGFADTILFDRRISVPLPTTDTKGLILTGPRAMILAFAGTDPLSFANWITDFDWVPKSGDLHTGFRMAADVAWNDSRAAARAAAKHELKLFITGHSLGGALVTLTANRLQSELGIVADAVYTYGMPRAGGPGLVAEYGAILGSRTFRFVHGGDIVPTVPPPQLGFQHVGRLLSCTRFGKFTATPSESWSLNDPLPPDAALTALREQIGNLLGGSALIDPQAAANNLVFPALPPVVSDHLPDRYLLALT
jgi:hypothetical protein